MASSAHLSAAEQFFREADTDHTGTLTFSELSALLRRKGYAGSDQQVKDMFNSLDFEGDGKITLEEFMEAMGERPPVEHKKAEMRRLFRSFDRNGDGRIDKSELGTVFQELRMTVSPQEIEKMIAQADKDKTGSIDYEEFIELVFGKQS